MKQISFRMEKVFGVDAIYKMSSTEISGVTVSCTLIIKSPKRMPREIKVSIDELRGNKTEEEGG